MGKARGHDYLGSAEPRAETPTMTEGALGSMSSPLGLERSQTMKSEGSPKTEGCLAVTVS